MKYFTHYWEYETCEKNREMNVEGTLLEHLSGNRFKKSKIEVGDIGYVVTVKDGTLLLRGKMIVGKYCDVNESARVTGLKPEQIWQADEHIIASKATPMIWDLEVPLETTKKLKFISGKNIKSLVFISGNRLDRQTMRGVRHLTPDSAALLNKFLGKFKPVELFDAKEVKLWKNNNSSGETQVDEFESYAEGTKKKKYVTYYERRPENRKQAIKIHGMTCKGCNFNFEKHYGSQGKGFIHVHHIEPVSQLEKPKKINVKTDLTVLCPNCHAMVHRFRNKTLSIAELKKIIADSKTKL